MIQQHKIARAGTMQRGVLVWKCCQSELAFIIELLLRHTPTRSEMQRRQLQMLPDALRHPQRLSDAQRRSAGAAKMAAVISSLVHRS